ncbi:MAG: hypothetical protein ACLTH3_01040 [Lachnospira sp.]
MVNKLQEKINEILREAYYEICPVNGIITSYYSVFKDLDLDDDETRDGLAI